MLVCEVADRLMKRAFALGVVDFVLVCLHDP